MPTTDAIKAAAEAAQALVSRMEAVYEHPAFKSVWTVSQLHVGPYEGPKWDVEFLALKSALAALRAPQPAPASEAEIIEAAANAAYRAAFPKSITTWTEYVAAGGRMLFEFRSIGAAVLATIRSLTEEAARREAFEECTKISDAIRDAWKLRVNSPAATVMSADEVYAAMGMADCITTAILAHSAQQLATQPTELSDDTIIPRGTPVQVTTGRPVDGTATRISYPALMLGVERKLAPFEGQWSYAVQDEYGRIFFQSPAQVTVRSAQPPEQREG